MTTHSSHFVLREEDSYRFDEALVRLRQDANARAVFLIDKNGQQIANTGETENFDTTSLASLTAGNVAATDGLAKLIGEREFSVLFHEGQQDHIHISIVAGRAILVVIFDERSSLGLVRLRVKRANGDFETHLRRNVEPRERRATPRAVSARSPRSPTRTSTPCSASRRATSRPDGRRRARLCGGRDRRAPAYRSAAEAPRHPA